MPFATYTDVVRLKLEYGPGEVDYEWHIMNPRMPVLYYDHNNNTFVAVQATQIAGVAAPARMEAQVSVYPNPAKGNGAFVISAPEAFRNSRLTLLNTAGQAVKDILLTSPNTSINLEGMAAGVYFYRICADGAVASGRLIVE